MDGIGMNCTSAMVGVGLGLTGGLMRVVVAKLYCDDPELTDAGCFGKYCCTGSCPMSANGLYSSASGIADAAAAWWIVGGALTSGRWLWKGGALKMTGV